MKKIIILPILILSLGILIVIGGEPDTMIDRLFI